MITIYIIHLKHKREINFIEIIKIFVGKEQEQSAYFYKAQFNETRPSYSMAEILTYNIDY